MIMTIKEIAIDAIKGMPDDITWDTIQDRINFMAGVRKGLSELDEGKGLPHDRVKEDFAKWLTH
jgi:predicted transcriptional regulator